MLLGAGRSTLCSTGVAPPMGCSPSALAKEVTFLVLETVWSLVWEEWLWMAVLLQRECLVAEWMEGMEVFVPIEDDTRQL